MKYGTAMALGGIAQGVERGIGLGMQIGDYKDRKEARKLDRAERKEDKAYDRKRDAESDKREKEWHAARTAEAKYRTEQAKFRFTQEQDKAKVAAVDEGVKTFMMGGQVTPEQMDGLTKFFGRKVIALDRIASEDGDRSKDRFIVDGMEYETDKDGKVIGGHAVPLLNITMGEYMQLRSGQWKGDRDEYNASENKRNAERGAREDKTREGLGGAAEKLKKLISQRDTALANGEETLAAELSLEIQKLEASMATWKGEIDVMSGGGATPPAGVGMGTAPVAPAAAPAQQPAADQASAQPVPSNYAVTNPRWRTTVADLITMARKKPELAKAPEAEVLAYLENEKFIEAVN